MQDNAMSLAGGTPAKRNQAVVFKQTHASVPYHKVVEGRKRPIRGFAVSRLGQSGIRGSRA